MNLMAMFLMQVLAMTTIQDNSLWPPIFNHGQHILFQGDSITDMGRGRSQDLNHIMGHGYVFLIAARYGAFYPDKGLTFTNRGVSGDKVTDLAKRWQTDTLDHKPDVISILIGVNDIGFNMGDNQAFSIEEYEKTYDKLLSDSRAANPEVKFVLCEPFILPGQRNSDKWDLWLKTVKQMQAVVAKLSEKYHTPVVHFQKIFDDAAKLNTPANYWIWDGIHPTCAGHQLMADEWVRAYHKFYGVPTSASGQNNSLRSKVR